MLSTISDYVLTRAQEDNIFSVISNPSYYTNSGIPNGNAQVFSYNIANYPIDESPTELLDGRTTGISATETAQYRNSCLINQMVMLNNFFDGNEYADANGKTLASAIQNDAPGRVITNINTYGLSLLEQACTDTNGVLLNQFESTQSGGVARYAKFTSDNIVDASGLYGNDLYAAILSAATLFMSKRENYGVNVSDLIFLVNPNTFGSLQLANYLTLIPTPTNSAPFFQSATIGKLLQFGNAYVIQSNALPNDGTSIYNAIVTKDAFAYHMDVLDPISTYKQQNADKYRPGTGYTGTYKYGVNIADPNKIVIVKTGLTDTIQAGVIKTQEVTPIAPQG